MSEVSKTQVSMFGVLDIRVGGVAQHLSLTGPTRSLLQYLLCFHDRLARREQLMEMFWPNTLLERRRSSLNSAIWRIKKALEAVPALGLDATADCVRLVGASDGAIEIDSLRLAEALRRYEDASDCGPDDLAALTGALERCTAVPLDGLDEDWAVIERERLEALRMRGLTAAMRCLARAQRYDEALEMGRRILMQEPYRESTVQELLCLHALNGERVRMKQLYERFSKALRRELDIAPLPETRALLDYLSNDGASEGSTGPSARRLASMRAARTSAHPGVDALLCSIERHREAFRPSA